jgi:hypothetical protein
MPAFLFHTYVYIFQSFQKRSDNAAAFSALKENNKTAVTGWRRERRPGVSIFPFSRRLLQRIVNGKIAWGLFK